MEQLAEQVQQVLNHFNIVKYIGVGVGLGSNVLIRHALGKLNMKFNVFKKSRQFSTFLFVCYGIFFPYY